MTAAAPLEIQIWPIDRLVLYARNPRKNDVVVDRMCSSIREFGFKIPVLARSDGEVVDGQPPNPANAPPINAIANGGWFEQPQKLGLNLHGNPCMARWGGTVKPTASQLSDDE